MGSEPLYRPLAACLLLLGPIRHTGCERVYRRHMTFHTILRRRSAGAAVLAAAAALVGAGSAGANVPLTRVSADPFTNATSQHATEVEPDTFAFGSTVVAT